MRDEDSVDMNAHWLEVQKLAIEVEESHINLI